MSQQNVNSQLHSRGSPKPRSAVKCVLCTSSYFFCCYACRLLDQSSAYFADPGDSIKT